MSDLISSIQTIAFCSGAIIASAALLWCLWKTYGFVGFPIGKMIMRVNKNQENPNDRDTQSKALAVTLGCFMCYGLIAWKTTTQEDLPPYSVPGERMYDIGFWLIKLVLSACGETAVVLAILSGVVKVLGFDGGKEELVELEKDEGRKA